MNRIDWKRLLPTILLGVFSLVMVWPLVFGGETYFYRDFGRFYAPVKQAYLDRLLQGELLIWLPEMNCGTPVHGTLVHAFLYPGNVLLFAGESLGWGLFFAAHLFLAGVGARAMARRLGAGEGGAFAAAIAFAGSGYFVSQMNHVPYATVAAWAPVIVATGLSLSEGKRRTVPLLALAFTMAALGGEPFSLLLSIVFLGILVLAGFAGRRIPAMLRIGGAGLVALLLASPVLLPAWDVLPESVRAAGFEAGPKGFGSVHPLRLTTLVSPECMGLYQWEHTLQPRFFGVQFDIEIHILLGIWFGSTGLFALAFAPLRRSRAALLLVAVMVGFGLLALGDHLGLAPLLTKVVPGLSRFRYADKYWLVVTLAAAPLIALALPGIRRRAGLVLAGIGAALAGALAVGFPEFGSTWTGIAAFGLVGAAVLAPAKWRVRALTTVLAVELLFLGVRHHITADPAGLNPKNGRIGQILKELEPGRIFVELRDPERNLEGEEIKTIAMAFFQNLDSHRGVGEGFSYSRGYDPTDPIDRLLRLFEMIVEKEGREKIMLFHRILRLSGTTHSITDFPLADDPQVRQILDGPLGVRCYRYTESVSRACLYGNVRFVEDVEAARELLKDPDFDPFRNLVVEGEGKELQVGTPRGSGDLIVDTDREVTLRLETDRPAWLFLADVYARGWQATVDGEPVEIRPAMAAFRAVPVPRGAHTVRFRYEPRWLRIAPVTFGIGVALLLGLAVWSRRSRKNRRRKNRRD